MKVKQRLVIWPDWVSNYEAFIEIVGISGDPHYQEPFSRANNYSESGQKDLANKLMDETKVWEVEVDTETGEIVRGAQVKEQWENRHTLSWCKDHQCIDRCEYDEKWSSFAWYRLED
jgi:hypothetical protein